MRVVGLIVSILSLALVGCSSLQRAFGGGATQSGAIAVAPSPDSKIVELVVARADLVSRLKNGAANRIRVIPTYSRSTDQGNGYPRYRLFDVEPEGPYYLLGLRDADILIAAHDYVVLDPRALPTYVTLLTNEDHTSLQLLRNGEAMVLKVKIQ